MYITQTCFCGDVGNTLRTVKKRLVDFNMGCLVVSFGYWAVFNYEL